MQFTIGIQITEGCTFKCGHCGTFSSPRALPTCSASELSTWIEQISSLDPRAHVGFTGGEPFLAESTLLHGVQCARDYSLNYGVITNGFWGERSEDRTETLKKIRDAKSLSLSYDVFHQRFIDNKVVKKIFHEALEAGLDALVHYTTIKGDVETRLLQEWGFDSKELKSRMTFSGLMPIGRGVQLVERSPELFPLCDNLQQPCNSLSVPVIRANGDVYACCGGSFYLGSDNPLYLGSMKSLSLKKMITKKDSNPIIQALRTIGPGPLLAKARIQLNAKEINQSIYSMSPCGCCRLLFHNKDTLKKTSDIVNKMAAKVKLLKGLYHGEI